MTIDAETTDILESIRSVITEGWGDLRPRVRLAGENLNLLVEAPDESLLVLRIAIDPSADVDLETAMLQRLDEAGLPVPEIVPDSEGRTDRPVTISGAKARARVHRFLGGTAWRDATVTREAGVEIGSTLARVHAALADFDPPGGRRTHDWDLGDCERHRNRIPLVKNASRRRILERVMQEQASIVTPVLRSAPSGMLHGDANDENLLLDGDRVVGILDLGDALHGALVQDLGLTLAYAAQHPDAGDLDLAAAVVEGYHAIRPLAVGERQVLFPLLRSRLASSALIGVARRSETNDHATWFSHEDTTWNTLERLATRSPAEGEAALCRGLGVSIPEVPDAAVLVEARRSVIGPSLSISYERPLHIVSGSAQNLFAADGRPYLDLVNNVCHVGHCHPRVVEALATQAARLNTNTRYLHEGLIQYAERLAGLLPDPLDTVFLVTSGSEANELALRIARAATGSNDVLVIDGAYHGHTGNCVAMSPYKFDGPGGAGRPEWVHVAPSPDRYRGSIRGDDEDLGRAYALELATVVGEACAGGRSIGAFFAEPILSCGGQVPLPRGYLSAAFAQVRRAGGLCIADEVQVGFGRVGDAFWGFELDAADGGEPVVPDIVVMGKPIGNGHPIGAVATTREIAEGFANGMEFFSTFGGNPVSCAVGNAVLDVIEEECLQDRAKELGAHFSTGLHGLMERHALIGDVRGRGLFLGIELVRDRDTLEPAAAEAASLVNAMRDRGILLSTDGPLHNVIKIKPPMVLDRDDIDMTIRLLDDVIADLG
ncbi:MAG: aminotransferase class III-fold pyridoxal phosphate-dependent enzyme [Phycisphaera sp.]|nr:aminotransferase class III-fold pyridoxal phosphate-dependent enzyme [Phycisphaera sp.]